MQRGEAQRQLDDISRRIPGVARTVHGGTAPFNGPAGPTDPIESAVAELRKAAGARILMNGLEATAAHSEADRLEADLNTLKRKLEFEELSAKISERTAPAAAGADVLLKVIEMVNGDKQQLLQANEKLRDQMSEVIMGQLAQMRDEMRTRISEGTPAPMELMTQQMAAVKAVIDGASQLVPTPSLRAATDDATVTLRMFEAEREHEFRMRQMQEESLARQAEWELRREQWRAETSMAERKLQADVSSRETFARSFETLTPQLVDAFSQNMLGAPPGQGSALPAAAQTMVLPCPHCQTKITVTQDATTVVCPSCQQFLQVGDDAHAPLAQQPPAAMPPPSPSNVVQLPVQQPAQPPPPAQPAPAAQQGPPPALPPTGEFGYPQATADGFPLNEYGMPIFELP